jgi:formamidopyrimidine-DNA glycosylase
VPELPEVETIALGLRRELLSRTFTAVDVLWERTVDRPDVPAFCARLTGATVRDVSRRGKFITMSLDTGQTLLTHLRMTGQFLFQPDHPTHIRVRFQLDDGRWLFFSDQRKFGRMFLVDDPLEVLGDLGPEPLADDFTAQRLAAMLAGRRGRVKPLLLDQTFVAGLGNIYTDEALWRAQIHPLQPAHTLTPDQAAHLHAGIVTVLRQAIASGGTTLPDRKYVGLQDDPGAHQESLAVYGRAGQTCPRCGATVERTVVGQRGTHFCPKCQELR